MFASTISQLPSSSSSLTKGVRRRCAGADGKEEEGERGEGGGADSYFLFVSFPFDDERRLGRLSQLLAHIFRVLRFACS